MKTSEILVGWATLVGVKRAIGRRSSPVDRELRYHVPPGQDPAAALAAVREAGLDATVAMDGGDEDVVVVCDPERDRERVRRILREAPVDMAGTRTEGPPIRFADEGPKS